MISVGPLDSPFTMLADRPRVMQGHWKPRLYVPGAAGPARLVLLDISPGKDQEMRHESKGQAGERLPEAHCVASRVVVMFSLALIDINQNTP